MEIKKITGLQLELAQNLAPNILMAPMKQAEYIAIFRVSNEVLRKYKTDPNVLMATIEGLEDMDYEEFGKLLSFFLRHQLKSQNSILKDLATDE